MVRSAYDVAADILDPSPLTEEAENLKGDLSGFIRAAWPVIEPVTEYLHNWHIDAISEYLVAVSRKEIRRLIINIPPRYMKSIAVSVVWPVWNWTWEPSKRWVFSSYSSSLSTKHSVDRRTIIQSPWFQERYGDVMQLRGDQNVKTEFQNDHRGHMIATSVKATTTGKGGDVLVMDDPVNPEDALSDLKREAANRYFDQTLTPRLDDKKRGAIVVVMQRLHEDDLTGHLLERGGWEHLKLPAVEEQQTFVSLPSGKTIEREPGNLLWPDREGPEEIASARRDLGSYGFAGQYQQDPAPLEGGMLKKQWWRFWVPASANGHFPPVQVKKADGSMHVCQQRTLPENLIELQSWDMAFKDKKDSDFVVGQVWGRTAAEFFLLDQMRDRMDLPRSVEAVELMSAKWPRAATKLVEDKANGPAVIQTLRSKVPGLIEVNPEGGKVARASAVSPFIESGNVWLPHPAFAPWVHDLIGEAAVFPNGANDDQVDALSQALLRMTLPIREEKTTAGSSARLPSIPKRSARITGR